MTAVNEIGKMKLSVFKSMMKENTYRDEPNAPDIDIINTLEPDGHPDKEYTPKFEFHYTNLLYHGKDVPKPDLKNLTHCDCVGGCDPESKTCPCIIRQRAAVYNIYGETYKLGCAYDDQGRIKTDIHDFPIFECNAGCRCDDEWCNNRVSHLPVPICACSHVIYTGCSEW